MPGHEFGIMQFPPENGKEYIDYEPEKYGCISVDDEYILRIIIKLKIIKCFHNSTDNPKFGLNYYGITLIPPESLGNFTDIVMDIKALSELTALLEQARREGKFVIHFGI